jgi:outer membrane protein
MGMFIARDQLGTLQKMAENNAKLIVTNTVAQVLTAYYEVVRGDKRVKNLKKGLEISNDRLKLSKDRYEVGQGSKVDFLSAQVDYNQDKSDVIAAEQILTNSKMVLNTLMVKVPSNHFSIIDSINIDNSYELAELKATAQAKNPNLVQAKFNNNMAEYEIKAQKAAQLPVVDLLSGYNYNTLNNGAGAPQSTKSGQSLALNYGLRASINIFDGYNQKRRIENAKLNSEITQLQEKDLINQLDLMIERNFQNYKNALELIKLENENYKIAYLNTEIAFERYRVGNSTSYELREVQRNAVAAETRLIEAEYSAKINEIELNRLSGKLLQ